MQRLSQAIILAFVAVLCVGVVGQPKATSDNAATDAFVGKWKLNLEKSSLPPERETIAIQRQGSNYRIDCSIAHGNGTELIFWTLTDMQGTPSKVTQANGKPMNEEWRVTREGSDAFVVDSRPFRTVVRYTVSSDGHTLTMREVSSSILVVPAKKGAGNTPVVRILVFDKVQ